MNYNIKDNYEEMFNNIVKQGICYIEDNKLESLILGVSGGIDSAITAVLSHEICKRTNTSLIGTSIPLLSNKEDEIKRSIDVGNKYCDEFSLMDITDTFINACSSLCLGTRNKNGKDINIRMGNIKARLRMIALYDLAYKENGLVLSTDNLTELMLGFWTLHGDVGDLGLIQSLWKTEVYGLARWMIDNGLAGKELDECIIAVPTDGLGITDCDLDQIACDSYDDVDKVLVHYLNSGEILDLKGADLVIDRHNRTKFKRNNPYNFSRESIVNE